MEAEARRIKMSAEYQSQIQQTIERMTSQEIIDESDYEDERSDHSEPEWIKEYPSEKDSPEEVLQSTRPTLTPLEATAELTRFRPIHGKPSDLKHLLECKADPNMPLKLGDISPLRKVRGTLPKCGTCCYNTVQMKAIRIEKDGIYANVLM